LAALLTSTVIGPSVCGVDVGQVRRDEEDGCAVRRQLVGDGPAPLFHDVDEADLGPLPRKGAHDGLADAARPAGDEDGAVGKARV
jgi:hypothetical protein